jgi:glycosyltransferase involved in cell wall biosynthesis
MISVIVPVLDTMPWLEEQLRALAAQECDEEWEVVLADNGSIDGSAEFCDAWAAARPGFHFVDASGARGTPGARNAGVLAASGDLLAFCDADDVVQAGWIAGCAAALQDADVIGGGFDLWTLNGTPPAPVTAVSVGQLGFLPAGIGANLAMRRSAFEAVGGFSEDVQPGEDIDLCWRLQLEGFRFAIATDAVVSRRSRSGLGNIYRQAVSYGRCGPALYRRYRVHGARPDVRGALKSWAWLVCSLPWLFQRTRRIEWARAVGTRLGRISGSLSERTFFP